MLPDRVRYIRWHQVRIVTAGDSGISMAQGFGNHLQRNATHGEQTPVGVTQQMKGYSGVNPRYLASSVQGSLLV
jgi:hypothetical protein